MFLPAGHPHSNGTGRVQMPKSSVPHFDLEPEAVSLVIGNVVLEHHVIARAGVAVDAKAGATSSHSEVLSILLGKSYRLRSRA